MRHLRVKVNRNGLLVALGLTPLGAAFACSEESICPYPKASPVSIAPATPCLSSTVETCIDPTLVIRNGCTAPLYLPTAYGRFGPDGAIGEDIEVLPHQTAHYVVRPEKATSQTTARKDFVIPARVTTQRIEISFSTLAE